MPEEIPLNIATSSSIYTTSIVSTKPSSICGSGAITLEATASGGADVLWFDTPTGGDPIVKGTTYTIPNLTTTTTYYALASFNGCYEGVRRPVIATVTPLPTIDSVTGDLVCESGSGILLASASAGVINWYDVPTGGTSLGSGTSFTTPVVSTTTIYYVDAIVSGCKSLNRTPVTLTVQKTQPPTAVQNQSFCDINQATISNIAITGNNVLWYASSSGGSTLNTTDLLVNNTTYYASQTENGCESNVRFSVTIQVNETVVVPQSSDIPDLFECDTDIDGDDTNGFSMFDLTKNETVLLNGKLSSDFTFSYFTDAGYSNPIATPPNAFINTVKDEQTIYVRIINNLNNVCYTDTLFDVKVNKLPVVQPAILFKNCDEDGLSDGFTNFNLNEVDDIITNNNASNFTITYYLLPSEAELGINGLSSPIFNNKTANIVYARVENTDGCYRVSTINLQVSTTSFGVNYTGESLENCDDDDTIDGLHVFDLTQAIQAFKNEFPLGQNLSVHYYKNSEDAQLEQNEILPQNSYINKTPFSEVLYVRVESDDNGECFGIGAYLQLTVHPRPEFEVDNSAIYCLDGNDITLTTFNPTGNFTYEWKDDTGQVVSNSSFATVGSGGTYTVIATSIASSISTCESFPKSFNVVESAKANIDIDDISIVELTDNNNITINNDNNNLGIGDYEFSLDNSNGPYQDEPIFQYVGAGSHTVYVKDKNGCGITSIEVFILGFPKFFTPNNDGTNDTWQIKGLGTDYTNASKVSIYNRYGKLIKQLTSKSGAWDGTFNGELLPDSDYWFLAELVEVTGETRIHRGHFSLIR
ncbi:T9SS type B sorting domain-containing protein [Thalassobellus suaedae]|uniref:T9SS type B sorting domain-containing protein n=1 Tax=Thalassobellus suaedae TaxID=3074124 RepID=A0ABY9XV41_9FLAO|nr:T9SS type B sorting domain-containing protein [Flavobacteriaceae bacterium HL-DH14]